MANGSETRARNMLESKNLEVRKSDAMQMCFFAGVTVTLLIFAFLLYFIHPSLKPDPESRDEFFSADAIYRTFFLLIYIILAAGICISVWTRYNINYMYIFGLSAKHKMT